MYEFGVALILLGFALTGVSAALERDWKSMVVALLFLTANGVIFLWRN